MQTVEELLAEIRSCKRCEEVLPLGPKPVLQFSSQSSILIVGQAPGTRVHETGVPWNDPSGNNLRKWMNVDSDVFYNTEVCGIVPMGFCYPGKGKSGDLPPRPECAQAWHEKVMQHMPNLKLTLLIGQYAQNHYLPDRLSTLTDTVKNWKAYAPDYFPLPHPSPRNNIWMKKNSWFAEEVLPALQSRVAEVLQ